MATAAKTLKGKVLLAPWQLKRTSALGLHAIACGGSAMKKHGNLPIESNSAIQTRLASHFSFVPSVADSSLGPTTKMNLYQAINNAMDKAMEKDPTAVVFGEDVAFGGVFRCSLGLQEKYGIVPFVIL
uniref:Transketolase-like pyrimidine-binding domain-containing protein n=1 Tax=Plectus sambesii TaxID=2011161 RepID=A0A914XMD0_9BILA